MRGAAHRSGALSTRLGHKTAGLRGPAAAALAPAGHRSERGCRPRPSRRRRPCPGGAGVRLRRGRSLGCRVRGVLYRGRRRQTPRASAVLASAPAAGQRSAPTTPGRSSASDTAARSPRPDRAPTPDAPDRAAWGSSEQSGGAGRGVSVWWGNGKVVGEPEVVSKPEGVAERREPARREACGPRGAPDHPGSAGAALRSGTSPGPGVGGAAASCPARRLACL
jgi:hypothetical protein